LVGETVGHGVLPGSARGRFRFDEAVEVAGSAGGAEVVGVEPARAGGVEGGGEDVVNFGCVAGASGAGDLADVVVAFEDAEAYPLPRAGVPGLRHV